MLAMPYNIEVHNTGNVMSIANVLFMAWQKEVCKPKRAIHDRTSRRRRSIADAVFNALLNARMRIFPPYLPWAVNLIGEERAARCNSLPILFRRPAVAG
jgi:hypothetical protein